MGAPLLSGLFGQQIHRYCAWLLPDLSDLRWTPFVRQPEPLLKV